MQPCACRRKCDFLALPHTAVRCSFSGVCLCADIVSRFFCDKVRDFRRFTVWIVARVGPKDGLKLWPSVDTEGFVNLLRRSAEKCNFQRNEVKDGRLFVCVCVRECGSVSASHVLVSPFFCIFLFACCESK